MPIPIVAADIGGTHARFALAELDHGQVVALGESVTLRVAEHPNLQSAWEEFGRRLGQALPLRLAIAVAGSVGSNVVKLTNNPWVIDRHKLQTRIGIEQVTILNDMGAVGHAVASLPNGHFKHICGPEIPIPEHGIITIVGPGTGLGVAALFRRHGEYDVIETEGGHMSFAPQDEREDRILAYIRHRFDRVSVERVASGPGLRNLCEALLSFERKLLQIEDEKQLWALALGGRDATAAAALNHLILALGGASGDLALAQGAVGVVIAGGVGQRLADHLPGSGFRDRFIAKGRFERHMAGIPVKLIMHPEPSLYGAAAAFARRTQ